jgi:hypothetical protein
LVELRLHFTILLLVLRNMFYRGAAIHLFVSDPTRVGDVTRILCNAVPPDRGGWINPTLKPVFRSAETWEAERWWIWSNNVLHADFFTTSEHWNSFKLEI